MNGSNGARRPDFFSESVKELDMVSSCYGMKLTAGNLD
jgi:hypothetical protein